MHCPIIIWASLCEKDTYKSHMWTVKCQVSLCWCAVLPEPSLLFHTIYATRGSFRQRDLAPLDSCVNAFERPPSAQLVRPLFSWNDSIIICFLFRTTFFMKENKYYTHVNFFLPFAYIMILGFFFTESTDKVSCFLHDKFLDAFTIARNVKKYISKMIILPFEKKCQLVGQLLCLSVFQHLFLTTRKLLASLAEWLRLLSPPL